MQDAKKTKEQLIKELAELRERMAQSEDSQAKTQRILDAWRDLWAQYEAMIEAFDGFIYICSQNYEVEFMNEHFIKRTGGYPLGQKCYQALHDLSQICPWCVNDRVFRGETVRWEVLSPKDNRWFYVVNTPIKHPDGSVSKMAMIQDITDRKQAEKAMQEAEAKYRGIFENAVEGIFQSTPAGRLLSVNPALASMFGFASPAEMVAAINDIGHQVFVDPACREAYKKEMEAAGVVRGAEYQVYRRDGSKFWVAVNARAVRDEQGDIRYYEGFIEEVAESRGQAPPK